MEEKQFKNNEEVLAGQIPEYTDAPQPSNANTPETLAQAKEAENEKPASLIGTKLKYFQEREERKEADKQYAADHGLGRVGDNIRENAEFREGWMEVDRKLLGERSQFYPEDWQFRIKPATVEAIRNWSTIDEENPLSVDNVFNEIMKSCFSIVGSNGTPIPWGNANSWDRFFFVLLIREYTFKTGENKISINEECPECSNNVEFTLNSQSLMYEMPDPEVMPKYNPEDRTWFIDPREYEVDAEPITLYLPTLEKENNIKNWVTARLREDKKVDSVFVRFLPWLAQKISKDDTIAKKQIREIEVRFNSWDTDMFSFMDEVLRNITITPLRKLVEICPICGEEVTTNIQFQDGIRSLFNVAGKHRKFGKK